MIDSDQTTDQLAALCEAQRSEIRGLAARLERAEAVCELLWWGRAWLFSCPHKVKEQMGIWIEEKLNAWHAGKESE